MRPPLPWTRPGRHALYAVLLAGLVLATSIAIGLTATQAVAVQSSASITSFTAPPTAHPGDQVQIQVAATADMAVANPVVLRMYDTRTGELICEDSGEMPIELSCSGQFQMPNRNVQVQATLAFEQGSELDYETTTITATETPSGGQAGNTTADPVDEDRVIDGIVSGVEDAFTSALSGFTDKFISTVADAVFGAFYEVLTRLVKQLATLMTYTPDVQGNQAVTELHQRTLAVATGTAVIATLYAGIAYITGGALTGMSPGQARRLLPQIIVGLTFAVLSLPLLQFTVEAANAMVTAFGPDVTQATLQEYVATSSALGIAVIVNAAALLGVVVAFIIRDAYILFIAAASPLIAIAWTLPGPRRYVQPLISGYWAALMMGPVAALVLRFTYTLVRTAGGTSSPLGQVANWLIGLAAFSLMLIIPVQIYAGYAGVAGSAHYLSRSTTRTIQRTIHRYQDTNSDTDSTDPPMSTRNTSHRAGHGSGTGHPPDKEHVEQANWYYRTESGHFRTTEPGTGDNDMLPPSMQSDDTAPGDVEYDNTDTGGEQ